MTTINNTSEATDTCPTTSSETGSTPANKYTYSSKYERIRTEMLVLEYVGKDVFMDEQGRKYVYDDGIMYTLDELTGERGHAVQ